MSRDIFENDIHLSLFPLNTIRIKKEKKIEFVTRTILHTARDRLARDRLTSVYTGINLITEQSRPLRPPSPWNSPRKRYFRMIQHTVPEWRATFDPCLPFCIAINLLTAASYVDERHSFSFFFSFLFPSPLLFPFFKRKYSRIENRSSTTLESDSFDNNIV